MQSEDSKSVVPKCADVSRFNKVLIIDAERPPQV